MNQRHILRAWTALIVLLLGVCLLGGLGSIGLVGPDEPRYASIAQTMARTGDFLTPRLWGHPWFEKPVLYYWSAAASNRVIGENDRAARLPSALAALLGALLLGWVAWRLYDAWTGRLALVLFPTSLGLFAFAHAATADLLLAVSLESAMIAALFVVGLRPMSGSESPAAPRVPLILLGACIGLGALAKGPVAVILAGGSVVLWAALTRRWREAIRCLSGEPIAAFAVVALPWYVLCARANPGFAYDFLWRQNVQRFLTPVFEHVQPWWFFIPVLALALLPWTLALVATARDGWRTFRQGHGALSPGVFLACWAAFPLLFFSFSQSKLPGYILPALPPLVLLLAVALNRICEQCRRAPHRKDRLATLAVALVGLTWIALALAGASFLHRLPAAWELAHHGAIRALLLATAAAGIVIGALALARRPRAAMAVSALWMGILVATLNWAFLPQLDPYLSARAAARTGMQMAERNAPLETYGLSRDWQYGLNYYFARALPEWSPAEPRPAWIYTAPIFLTAVRAHHPIEFTLPFPNGLLLVRAGPHGR